MGLFNLLCSLNSNSSSNTHGVSVPQAPFPSPSSSQESNVQLSAISREPCPCPAVSPVLRGSVQACEGVEPLEDVTHVCRRERRAVPADRQRPAAPPAPQHHVTARRPPRRWSSPEVSAAAGLCCHTDAAGVFSVTTRGAAPEPAERAPSPHSLPVPGRSLRGFQSCPLSPSGQNEQGITQVTKHGAESVAGARAGGLRKTGLPLCTPRWALKHAELVVFRRGPWDRRPRALSADCAPAP